MATISELLRLTLQETNDNVDTWGTVLNSGAIELIEDSFNRAEVDVTSANQTLNIDPNIDNPPHYRRMIIDIIGSPGAARNVIAPDVISTFNITKVWLVINNTTGGQTITFKTSAGGGVVIPAGVAYWCYGDGTDIVAAQVETAGTAGTTGGAASDTTLFAGLPDTAYAKLAVSNTFTAGQHISRATALTDVASVITPDLADSNSFFAIWAGNYTLAAPLNAINGSQFTIAIEQASGGPHTIAFATNTFMFENGIAPVLSLLVNDIDFLGFERVTNLTGGARWIGSVMKKLTTV